MTSQQQDTPGRTSPTKRAEVVDNICDAFERAWQAGQQPNIEDYLDEADQRLRGHLLEELLLSDLRLQIGSGTTPDRDDYVRRFPECAELIDGTIVQADKVSTALSRRVTMSRSADSGSGRGLSVRCPHCHNPIQVVVDARLDDITCSTCGSHFSLVQEETTTRDASKITTVGHFELIERLGLGGFGTVWKARDTRLDRTVAVKIPRHGQFEPSEAEKFLREARAIAQLNHPNIVRVYEVGRDYDLVYIVSDLVRGVSLADRLTAGPLTAREAAELCAKIADALAHAHEAGIVHRDLKPQNIMVDAEGEPILMDFGLARRDVGEVTVTVDGQLLGTPAYMSPEQARGEAHHADHRTDLYSLGVILFELLTGERPFRGNARMLIQQVIHDEPSSPRGLNSGVPQDLETICLKCLEKEPANRYSTGTDISDELRRFLRDEPIHARPISAWQHSWRWCRRNPVVSALAATVVLSLLMGVGISSYYAIKASTRAEEAEAQRVKALELAAQNQALAKQEQAARREAEYGSYILQMNLASANVDRGNVMVARPALLAAPREFRNWEWGYLVNRAWPAQVKLEDAAVVARVPEISDAEYWAAAPARVVVELDHEKHTRLAGVAFNLDASRVATTAADGSVRLWNAQTGDKSGGFPPLGSIHLAVAFSYDKSRVAVGDSGGVVYLLNLASNKVLWKRPVPADDVGSASNLHAISKLWFGPNDTRLLVAHFDGTVRVWEAETGRLVRSFREHPAVVQSFRFHKASGSVMTASRDGSIRVWDIDSGQETQKLRFASRQGGISIQAISPDLRHVATGYYDGSVILQNLETGEARALYTGTLEISDLLFSPDETCLIAMIGSESVRVLDVSSGVELATLKGVLAQRPSVAISFDGSRIVTNSTDGISRIWAPVPSESEERVSFENAHTDTVIQAAFSSDGRRIVSVSYDKTAKVWDTRTQELLTTFTGHSHELLMASFSPDGKRVASVSAQGTVRVWDVATGMQFFAVQGSDEFWRTAASEGGLRGNILGFSAVFSASPFVPAGDKLVAYDDGELVVIDSSNGKRLATLQGNPTVCWPVISPSARHVATITATLNDSNVWDLISGRKIHTLSGHDRQADWATFNRDGTRLLTSSMDKTTFLWDVVSGKPLHRLVGHEGNVVVSRFSPDGRRIASASVDGTARIWDAATGEPLSTFSGHTGRLTNVEYHPDGTRVLTTAIDNTARVWDPTGPKARELIELRGRSKLVYGTWSPDGHQILTCWSDGSMQLFDAFRWRDIEVGTDADAEMGEHVRAWRESGRPRVRHSHAPLGS